MPHTPRPPCPSLCIATVLAPPPPFFPSHSFLSPCLRTFFLLADDSCNILNAPTLAFLLYFYSPLAGEGYHINTLMYPRLSLIPRLLCLELAASSPPHLVLSHPLSGISLSGLSWCFLKYVPCLLLGTLLLCISQNSSSGIM